ncbi:MAG: Type 1 glutamine amidotransferase-like domain-containing protein [Thermoanaerobaculia bacterium]
MATPLTVPGTPSRGWLVLIGGGEFSFGETEEIDRFLLGKLPPDRRRIAFLPTASGSTEYARHFAAYVHGLDPEVEVLNVPVYRGRDARRGRNLEWISEAGMVYAGGGIVNRFLFTIRESPAEEAMRAVLDGGGIVAAIGAAASAFGAVCRDMEGREPWLEGLDWISDSVIETSFEPADDTGLRRLVSLPRIQMGFGIPAGMALAIAPDRSGEIVGSGSLAVVRKP